MENVSIREAKRYVKESVQIYLEKDENGRYRIPQNKQRPLCLIGPSGIGKTEIAKQVAEECDIGFVSYSLTHHTRQSAVGLPSIVMREYDGMEYEATEYTVSEIVDAVYQYAEYDCTEGILFVDEVNCVSETMSAVMLQFLQNKCFGTHMIPEGWIIVAAGNTPEYNHSVREFDAVTCDRLRIIYLKPDIEAWMEYADKQGIHPVITSFLRNCSDSFYTMVRKGKEQRIVTARGWEDLSNILKSCERMGYQIDKPLIEQFIQCEETANSFFNYYELYQKFLEENELERLYQGGDVSGLIEQLRGADFQIRWTFTGIFLKRLESEAAALVPVLKQIQRKEEETDLSGVKEGVRQWHLLLDRCLDVMENAFGKGAEMEYFLSGICRNHDIGYLLAMKKNDKYMTLFTEMSKGRMELEALRRGMKSAV